MLYAVCACKVKRTSMDQPCSSLVFFGCNSRLLKFSSSHRSSWGNYSASADVKFGSINPHPFGSILFFVSKMKDPGLSCLQCWLPCLSSWSQSYHFALENRRRCAWKCSHSSAKRARQALPAATCKLWPSFVQLKSLPARWLTLVNRC